MKQLVIIFACFCIAVAGFCQPNNADSLKKILQSTTVDSVKLETLDRLIDIYAKSNWDSVIVYADQLLALAEKLNDKNFIASSQMAIGYAQYNKGNFPKALALVLKAVKYFEAAGDKRAFANSLNAIGNIYKGQENYTKAKLYYRQCEAIAETINDTNDLIYSCGNLAYVYEKLNADDSSRYYVKKFLSLPRIEGYSVAAIYLVQGSLHLKRGDNKLAKQNFETALKITKQEANLRDISRAAISLASYYRKVNEPDSAILYANEGVYFGKQSAHNKTVYEGYETLYALYDLMQVNDSAFKYLRLASVMKDSLYNLVKLHEIETLADDEENRNREIADARLAFENRLKFYALGFLLLVFLVAAFLLWRNNSNKQKAYALLQLQKGETDAQKQVAENALANLKSAQAQLIHAEKMASLGELTAGIAHEIQNPLNFVNNFSDLNQELIGELKDEIKAGNYEEVQAIANDIETNEGKINHHGKRAQSIVAGMLQHSRSGKGEKQPTDINKLADEYLRLAYHGIRSKDKHFNCDIETSFDENIGDININSQEIGRVILNLVNNAFYAVNERSKSGFEGYKPAVTITTKRNSDIISIHVADNGNGIPAKIKEKIFNPFFTTKPTGQGTGLGLSLSYDIVKAHGGNILVDSAENEGTRFTINLPTT